MKNDNTKEKMANLWKKTIDISKKAAEGAQKGAKAFAEQAKENYHEQQLKKYQPLTKEEFFSEDFHIPNVIEIVDDAVRRDIVVCEGAIGWRELHKDVEVLHLYDEFVDASGIEFVPFWKCDNVYCVDPFDRKRYLNINCIFNKATEERIAELEHIAYSLGARLCSIEMHDNYAESTQKSSQIVIVSEGDSKKNKKSSKQEASINAEVGRLSKTTNSNHGKKISHFQGHTNPEKPQLKWFAYDDNVKRLIEMRCSDPESIKSTALELSGASSAVMSRKTACAIDKILKVKGSISMESQSIKEQSQSLIFEIEF